MKIMLTHIVVPREFSTDTNMHALLWVIYVYTCSSVHWHSIIYSLEYYSSRGLIAIIGVISIFATCYDGFFREKRMEKEISLLRLKILSDQKMSDSNLQQSPSKEDFLQSEQNSSVGTYLRQRSIISLSSTNELNPEEEEENETEMSVPYFPLSEWKKKKLLPLHSVELGGLFIM